MMHQEICNVLRSVFSLDTTVHAATRSCKILPNARKMNGKIISVEPILTNSRAYNSRQCPLENNCLPDLLVL